MSSAQKYQANLIKILFFINLKSSFQFEEVAA